MSSESMVTTGGHGGRASVPSHAAAVRSRCLPRTRSAPGNCLLPETYPAAPELISSAGPPPSTGLTDADAEQQQTNRGRYVPAVLRGLVPGACDATKNGKEKETLPREMRGSLLVVASLLASVTYQAGMNPPGGLWQDTSPEGSPNPHRAGDPVLQDTDSTRFTLFNLFNSFAFAYSVGAMMQLITESVVAGWPGGPRRVRSLLGFGSLKTMKYMMILSLLYLGVAFAAGSCRNWWCSLGAIFSPMYYFMSCVAFDLLYSIFRRRQERKAAARPVAEQVEVAVEDRSGPDDDHIRVSVCSACCRWGPRSSG